MTDTDVALAREFQRRDIALQRLFTYLGRHHAWPFTTTAIHVPPPPTPPTTAAQAVEVHIHLHITLSGNTE